MSIHRMSVLDRVIFWEPVQRMLLPVGRRWPRLDALIARHFQRKLRRIREERERELLS